MLIPCHTSCCLPRGTKGQLGFKFGTVEIALINFSFVLSAKPLNRRSREGNRCTPRKPLAASCRNNNENDNDSNDDDDDDDDADADDDEDDDDNDNDDDDDDTDDDDDDDKKKIFTIVRQGVSLSKLYDLVSVVVKIRDKRESVELQDIASIYLSDDRKQNN